jgi:endo-1,3-1,4-beta-glycanase ExoK
MRILLLSFLTLLAMGSHAHPQEISWPPRHQDPFIDRFEGPQLHPRWSVADGRHSGEWFSAEWRASQLRHTPEGLDFVMAHSPPGAEKPYMSAEIRTHEAYLYGYFEARLRMPRGPGLVAAFFTFTLPGDRETQNEIDMELLGRDPLIIELTYHVGSRATRQIEVLGFDASSDFHTYAFEWRPDSIRWYLDNRLVHISREEQVRGLVHPQNIEFSLWNSERMPRWLGRIDPAQAPWLMTVSCVAYAPRYEGRSLCGE